MATGMSAVLSVAGVRRVYGKTVAVDGITFEVGTERNRRAPGPQRGGEDHHHQHDPRGALPFRRNDPDRRGRHRRGPRAGAAPHEFRRRLRPAARKPDRFPEPPLLRPPVRSREPPGTDRGTAGGVRPGDDAERQVRPPVVRRADARLPRQGDDQPPAPPPPRRADGVPRPGDRPRHPREDPASSPAGTRWASSGPRTTCTR